MRSKQQTTVRVGLLLNNLRLCYMMGGATHLCIVSGPLSSRCVGQHAGLTLLQRCSLPLERRCALVGLRHCIRGTGLRGRSVCGGGCSRRCCCVNFALHCVQRL
jgi:hypothetical protein